MDVDFSRPGYVTIKPGLWRSVAFFRIPGGGQEVVFEHRITGEQITTFGAIPPDDCKDEKEYRRRFYPDGRKREKPPLFDWVR